jgi:protein-L-isoaspartate(D-aspartate) O-methyltransferase
MVNDLVDAGALRTPAVEAAFRSVPREAFVPPGSPAEVYVDSVIPVSDSRGRWLTTSSQPTMMAIMLEQLDVRPGQAILEIGAGTGYNAALLARLTGPRGRVHSVEYEPEAARRAAETLARVDSPALAHPGDGADGWPPGAPYDRIISSVAVWDIPDAWSAQAAANARLVAPFTLLGSDYSIALDRESDSWRGRAPEACSFVRFKGRMAHPEQRMHFDGENAPSLTVTSESGELPSAPDLDRWLAAGRGEPVEGFDARGAWEGFLLWLLMSSGPERLIRLTSGSRAIGWQGIAVGIWDEGGFAAVTAAGRLIRYGQGDTPSAVRSHLNAWRAAGRPSAEAYRLSLVPGREPPGPARLPRFTHTWQIEV